MTEFEQFVIDWYLNTLPRTIALVEVEPDYPRQQMVLERLRNDLAFWQRMNDNPTIDPGSTGLNGHYSPPEEMGEEADDELPF